MVTGVQTCALPIFCSIVPIVIKNGADWYRGIGPEKNNGTKAFALTGNIENTGLI